jgi:uncharacterized membrane protein
VRSKPSPLALVLITALSTALLFSLALARYQTVHQRTFDLALYARIAWGFAHGNFWSPVLDTHALGAHITPIWWPLGWLGRVFGTVPTLLFVQALCVASCVWPLSRIGARRMGERGAWLAVVAWLLYPNLGHVATYELHPGTLALLPTCWAMDALDRGDLRGLWLTCASLLLFREDLMLGAAMFGIAFTGLHRDRRALWLSAASALMFVILFNFSSAFSNTTQASLDGHYGVWGGSPLGVLKALFTEPARVLAHFAAFDRASYLPRVLLPLAFLSLREPWLLLPALPTLAMCLLSTFPTAQQQYSHYLSPALPALVASAVAAACASSRPVQGVFFVTLLAGHVLWGGLPLSRDFDGSAFVRDASTLAAQRVLEEIPEGRSVQAPDPLLPHLIERPIVKRAPPPEAGTDFVVLDLSHRVSFFEQENLLRTIQEPSARAWLGRANHALLVYAPPYALLERGRPARVGPAIQRYFVSADSAANASQQRLSACLSVVEARRVPEGVALVFVAHGPCPADLAARIGVDPQPRRVDLLWDGALSPTHVRAGDVLLSTHRADAALLERMSARGVTVGLIRQNGAPLVPSDPISVSLPLLTP